MTTKQVLYTFEKDSILTLNLNDTEYLEVENYTPEYNYIILNGKFVSYKKFHQNDEHYLNNNILGENDVYLLDEDNIQVPITQCTEENMKEYNVKIIDNKETFKLNNNVDISMYEMEIGKDYYEQYMMLEENGMYLELHDLPHFYYCNDETPQGFLLIGKNIGEKIKLTAIQVPKNKGLYISPFTIHCDALLVGNYSVIYGKTNNYITMLLKNSNRENVSVNIV